MRVEFCGPSGVGKSTIMAACAKKKPKRLEPLPVPHSPFLDFVADCYREVRYKRDGYLTVRRYLARAMAADAARRQCWYSELLAQRGLSLALARPGQLDLVRRYYALMPWPALTVFVTGSPKLIIQRNRERIARGKDDRSASVKPLCEAVKVAIECAAGHRFLVLDAAAPIEANAARVLQAVEGLSDAQ